MQFVNRIRVVITANMADSDFPPTNFKINEL